MGEALPVLLGEEAKGLSANVVSCLKAHWSDEWQQWDRRDLSSACYVYWWADGIHTGVKGEGANGKCLLVIVGVTPEGRKERVAIADGFRESTASWREVLLDLKARGLQAGPLLAVGDGAMGFWAALDEVFAATRTQRCWLHKLGNVLNALPTSQQARAKAAMQDIFMAATRADALAAFESFIATYGAKPMAQSIRRPWKSVRRTGIACWRSMTSRPGTGSMYEPPFRLNRRLPPCDTGPRGPGTACRAQRFWGWRSR